MAEGLIDKSKVLQSLNVEVKCPLCQDIFTKPKRLPCEHVFCEQCLQVLILRATSGSLTCPVCRKHTPLQNFDVNQFQTAYQVNRLIEIYKHVMKQQTTTTSPEGPQCDNCTLHTSQPLALYCETCKNSVCLDCITTSCSKQSHDYGFLQDVAKKYYAELEEVIKPLRTLHRDISTALLNITIADQQLEREKEKELERVETTFVALINIFQQEKRCLTMAIQNYFKQQFTNNTSKREELSEVVAELAKLIQGTDSVSLQGPIPVLCEEVVKKQQDVRQFHSKFTKPMLDPVKVPKLVTKLWSPVELEESCKEKFSSYPKIHSLTSESYNRSPQFQLMQLCKPFNATKCIESSTKLKIDSTLVCNYNNSLQTVSVMQLSPDKFQLSVVPQRRGRHKLHIQHNDIHLCGSPIPSYVYVDPRQITTLCKPMRQLLHNPVGVKCHEDKIYVVEIEKGIAVLEHSNKSMTLLNRINLVGANKIMIHDNHIYCTDLTEDRVFKTDMDGHLLTSTGGPGTHPGLFNFPNGIRLSKQNEIYVCDSRNDRIQVFNVELDLMRTVGEQGTAPGQFSSPEDLDFDEDGNIYVVERGNHRVQVLTPQEKHIRFISKFGSRQGNLHAPISIAIHNRTVYITDSRNGRISVFTMAGEYIATFGKGELTKPECIAINKDGFIFVTNKQSEILKY